MDLPEKQATVTRDVQLVKKRIRELDEIFGKSDRANWWKAFRQGPITYWLRYYFGNDEVGLWEAIDAKIADIINDSLKTSAERIAEIEKRLTILDAEITSAKALQRSQTRNHTELTALAKRDRAMPKRLQDKVEGAFVDFCV
tara:strand:- start:55 stop:480 length:426 start_codon:yes stop_codon:yes gene_type:complete